MAIEGSVIAKATGSPQADKWDTGGELVMPQLKWAVILHEAPVDGDILLD